MTHAQTDSSSRASGRRPPARRAALRPALAWLIFTLGFLAGAALATLLWASEPGAPFRFVYEAF